MVMNATARVVAGGGKYEYITALATSASANTIQGCSFQVHLCPRCRSCILPACLHASLCSAGCGDLAVLRTATELLKRSFHIVALVIWNRTFALAHHIQSTVSVWPKNPPLSAGL